MKHYTPLISTDDVDAATLNSRLEELNTGIDDLARDAEDIAYSTSIYPLGSVASVEAALDMLARFTGLVALDGYVSGLQVQADAATNTVTIGVGQCAAIANSSVPSLIEVDAEIVIDITAAGVNGLDTGALAANTSYGVWLVKGGSGVAAVISLATSPVSDQPTPPVGYTDARRLIGAIFTDGSVDVIGQITPGGQGTLRRVMYTEVTDAAPYKLLDEANIGDSGSPTTVDMSGLVPVMAVAAIVMIEINTPGAAVDVLWGNAIGSTYSLILTHPGTGMLYNTYLDLPTFRNPSGGAIYGSATDEDISLIVMGYVDASLNPFDDLSAF
jgi:hypothetical protein